MTGLKAIKRALDILMVLGQDSHELGVTEIAKRLAMNKSTVSRVLATLKAEGFVTQNPADRKYRLGLKVLELASIVLSTMELRKVAAPRIRELSEKVNETVDMYIIDGHHRVCIDRAEGNREVRTALSVGNRAPLHAGAPGKLLLAFLPEEKRNALVKDLHLRAFTSKTITSPVKLLEELDTIRNQGFATSLSEYVDLFNSVAAPIRDSSGSVIAALGMSGLVNHFNADKVPEYAAETVKTADLISRELGYVPHQKAAGETGVPVAVPTRRRSPQA